MDDLDVRIIKELGSPSSLQWNVRETYSGLARRLGVDEETVRRRLKRSQELGSVTGWKTMINPHLLGCEAACLDLNLGGEVKKEKVLSQVLKTNGVVKVLNFRGEGLQLTFYYENKNALKEISNLISTFARALDVIVWGIRFPRCDIKISETDWRILDSILDDARKSVGDIAKSTGISPRTIERRLAVMAEGHAVYLQGTPIFKNFAGVSCVFLVYCPSADIKRKIDELILSKVSRVELANTTGDEYSTFAMIFDNLSQADEFTNWIESLEGVASVKMGIMKDLYAVQYWLRMKVRERMP